MLINIVFVRVSFVSACHVTWFVSEAGRVEFIVRVGSLPPSPPRVPDLFLDFTQGLCRMAGRDTRGKPLYSTRGVEFAHAQQKALGFMFCAGR